MPPIVQQHHDPIPHNIVVRKRLFDLAEEDNADIQAIMSRKVNYITDHLEKDYDAIVEGFRIGVTQQPFKIPYWATLLALVKPPLSLDNPDAPINWPHKLLDDFCKQFQGFVDKLQWREMRLCVQFFAQLTTIGIITPESMFALLRSFISVLDEPGVACERASLAAVCVGEGLLRSGSVLQGQSANGVTDLIGAIATFAESVTAMKGLVHPLVRFHDLDEGPGCFELLESLVTALRTLEGASFPVVDVIPQPHLSFPKLENLTPTYELPVVLVPPAVIEIKDDSDMRSAPKPRELPTVYLRVFETEPTIDSATPEGFLLRSTWTDMIDIYEINRKEAARVLLDSARWFKPGTFRPKPGTAPPPPPDDPPPTGYQLELSVMEAIITNMLVLPSSQHKQIYYCTLVTEICKLSATTCGPAVGKSIRKLYSLLNDGLDVEVARRFSEWFSIHMSNFTYQWVWKEWAPDLELDPYHPRRTFMRRALDLEVRLGYYDRILKTLPEGMQAPEALVMPAEAPGYEFEYESESNPYAHLARQLQERLAKREEYKTPDVVAFVEAMRGELLRESTSESRAMSTTRSITVQCLLVLGARSFSHFLNVVERYLPVLHAVSGTPDAKFEILGIVSGFWRRNGQFIGIIFDKLMQYQIVDPADVVSWAFEGNGLGPPPSEGLSTFQWEVMKSAVDKANGRVYKAQARVVQQTKADDDVRAAKHAADVEASATNGDGMEVDVANVNEPEEESADLQKAKRAHGMLVGDQKAVLARVMEGFATVLGGADEFVSSEGWKNRGSWGKREWEIWETWGWYRHFCREYASHLRTYSETLGTVYLSKVAEEKPSGALLRRIWTVAVEQDG